MILHNMVFVDATMCKIKISKPGKNWRQEIENLKSCWELVKHCKHIKAYAKCVIRSVIITLCFYKSFLDPLGVTWRQKRLLESLVGLMCEHTSCIDKWFCYLCVLHPLHINILLKRSKMINGIHPIGCKDRLIYVF